MYFIEAYVLAQLLFPKVMITYDQNFISRVVSKTLNNFPIRTIVKSYIPTPNTNVPRFHQIKIISQQALVHQINIRIGPVAIFNSFAMPKMLVTPKPNFGFLIIRHQANRFKNIFSQNSIHRSKFIRVPDPGMRGFPFKGNLSAQILNIKI